MAKKSWRQKLSDKEILKIFEEAKKIAPEFNVVCHPNQYSDAQKLVSRFIEFYVKDSKVIWSRDADGRRRVFSYYTDTKGEGSFLQGLEPEDNWDQIASKFFEAELKSLLQQLPYESMKKESQVFLDQVMEQAQKLFKNDSEIIWEKTEI